MDRKIPLMYDGTDMNRQVWGLVTFVNTLL